MMQEQKRSKKIFNVLEAFIIMMTLNTEEEM